MLGLASARREKGSKGDSWEVRWARKCALQRNAEKPRGSQSLAAFENANRYLLGTLGIVKKIGPRRLAYHHTLCDTARN